MQLIKSDSGRVEMGRCSQIKCTKSISPSFMKSKRRIIGLFNRILAPIVAKNKSTVHGKQAEGTKEPARSAVHLNAVRLAGPTAQPPQHSVATRHSELHTRLLSGQKAEPFLQRDAVLLSRQTWSSERNGNINEA
jgi:hypothetical protein